MPISFLILVKIAVASYVLGLETSLSLSIVLSSKYPTRTSSLLPRIFSLEVLLVRGFAGVFFSRGFTGAFFAIGLLPEALVVLGGSTTLVFFFETPIEERIAILEPLVSGDGDRGSSVSITPV